MSVRITTWNVNGIRNPFGYMPWKDNRSFESMFDILETDIVCFQELKIQRQDLTDDMVLINGWDSYFTFPKHKKGYSGVAIFTRQSKVQPIRAEEGITGHLKPAGAAKSSDTYLDLPEDQQIGGYPDVDRDDALILDSEGRAVVVDFGGFVLIGTYCPVGREEQERADFRQTFLLAVEARVRNLEEMGRRVVVVGDLNISRAPMDDARAWEVQRKQGPDCEELVEWRDRPAKKMLNNLCEPSEEAVMVDTVRHFFPDRVAMYTHWETKINARPGNFGSRIDYVLATTNMKDWLESANIQEGLLGSDHCPVYAVLKAKVTVDGEENHLLDLLNPPGVFVDGQKVQEPPPPPKMSARLIPQFKGRRSIKDMFQRPKAIVSEKSTIITIKDSEANASIEGENDDENSLIAAISSTTSTEVSTPSGKHKLETLVTGNLVPERSPKRPKSTIATATKPDSKKNNSGKTSGTQKSTGGQKSLAHFFQPKQQQQKSTISADTSPSKKEPSSSSNSQSTLATSTSNSQPSTFDDGDFKEKDKPEPGEYYDRELDPFVTKESWSKLFTKPSAPLCSGHNEPCKQMTTKKPGVNCGRSFWICARPVGPSGPKERGQPVVNDEWRCTYFKWCSEWNSDSRNSKS